MDETPREKLIDGGLGLFVQQGFSVTTLIQISEAAKVSPDVAAGLLEMTSDIVIWVNAVILDDVANALPELTHDDNLVEALLVASVNVIDGIVGGMGVVTRDRLAALAHVLNAEPELQALSSAYRKQMLASVLARKLGATADPRRVRRAVMTWSAVVAGAHNPHPGLRLHVDPSRDCRVPELMSSCLSESYRRITGQLPPPLV
jgi:hypothetical protein